MKPAGYMKISLALLALILLASSASAMRDLTVAILDIVGPIICSIAEVFFYIVTGVAVVVITLAGVKWTASEADPGARKAAKDTIIHAIVGMILVLAAGALVSMIVQGSALQSLCDLY